MAFLNSMNITASALTAQRVRLDVASENIAHIHTTRTEEGGPYRRKMVVFEPIGNRDFRQILKSASSNQGPRGGVMATEIVEDEQAFKPVYNPSHPDANEQGYVMMPNVDLLKETVDSMAAARSYDANITALNTLKTMAAKGLEIGR